MTQVICTIILTLLVTFQVSAATVTLKVRYYFDSNTINSSVNKSDIVRDVHRQLLSTFSNSKLQNRIGFTNSGYETISIPNTNQAGFAFVQVYDDAISSLPNNLPILLQEMKDHKLDLAIAIIDRSNFCGVSPVPETGQNGQLNHPAFGVSFHDISCIDIPTYPAHEISHGMGLKHGKYVADLYDTISGHWDNPVDDYVGGYGEDPWFGNPYGTVMSGYYIQTKKGVNSIIHNHFSDKERLDCGEDSNRACGDKYSDGCGIIFMKMLINMDNVLSFGTN